MSIKHDRFKRVGQKLNLYEAIKTDRMIDLIVIHHSGTTSNKAVGANLMDSWHKERWGKHSGIGYHFVVRRSGEIEIGRALDYQGAHAKGSNRNSIGICLEGGKPLAIEKGKDLFTTEQMFKLMFLVRTIKVSLGQTIRVLGHSETKGSSTVCPAINVPRFRANMILQEML